jgi:hypothetical protein
VTGPKQTCSVRVPDNGDSYACGSEVVRAGFCAEHLPDAIETGLKQIDHAVKVLTSLLVRQAGLQDKPASKLFLDAAHLIEAKGMRERFVEERHLDPEAAEEALRRAEALLKEYGG